MIFDGIEWDEHNLGHATRRLTASEIEQAIWNAVRMVPHRRHPGRVLFRSITNGGKSVVIIAQVDHNRVRPITGWEVER